jgi:hypothetical protein
MRTAVDHRTGRAFDPTALTELVNAALVEFSVDGDWPWFDRTVTLTTVVGQGQYTLPPDFTNTTAVTVDGTEYQPVAMRDIDAYATDPTYPSVWPALGVFGVQNGVLFLRPLPGAVYSVLVRYDGTETPLVNDLDEPLAPSTYHQAVVELASSYAFDRLDKVAQAERFHARYERLVAKFRKAAMREKQGPFVARVRPGSAF